MSAISKGAIVAAMLAGFTSIGANSAASEPSKTFKPLHGISLHVGSKQVEVQFGGLGTGGSARRHLRNEVKLRTPRGKYGLLHCSTASLTALNCRG